MGSPIEAAPLRALTMNPKCGASSPGPTLKVYSTGISIENAE